MNCAKQNAERLAEDIAVLDLKTLAVTGHIDVGGERDGLAWALQP
jgi:hypothetical protein